MANAELHAGLALITIGRQQRASGDAGPGHLELSRFVVVKPRYNGVRARPFRYVVVQDGAFAGSYLPAVTSITAGGTDYLYWADIGAATRWCSRRFRVARGYVGHRSRCSRRWRRQAPDAATSPYPGRTSSSAMSAHHSSVVVIDDYRLDVLEEGTESAV